MSWKASAIAKELTQGVHGEKLNTADKLVLMILSENYMEKVGYVWCSQFELARLCLCTDRGVRGILNRLEEFGLIEVRHRHRSANRYRLLFMRNEVPHSETSNKERRDINEERESTPMRNVEALNEERDENVSILLNGTVKETVDGTPPGACPECGARQDLCHGHRKGKKKERKPWPRRDTAPSWKESRHVEEKRPRKTGEDRAREIAKNAEILFHPERIPERLRPILPPRRSR